METPPHPESRLFELYKIAVEEYRFQVRFNWDRTRDYLVLNGALVSVALALQKGGLFSNNVLVALILLLASGAGVIGIFAQRKGHEYYRRTIYKKTLIEDQLGLSARLAGYSFEGATLALTSTAGHRETTSILHETPQWLTRKLRKNTVSFWVVTILSVFSCLELIAAAYYIYAAARTFSSFRLP